MEGLLHYVWANRIFPATEMRTTDGRRLEVIDVGQHNRNQGPDFFNAKIRLDDTLWVGNVEIHVRASDWFRHGHEQDAIYDNTVLHVVTVDDAKALTHAGLTPAQFVLSFPERLRARYEELSRTVDYPRCHRLVRDMEAMKVHAWMDALLVERLMVRSETVLKRVQQFCGDWERTSFVTLARNFGFGLNGDTFEQWACRLPLQAVGKHRDRLEQVAAIFLGMAGFLDKERQWPQRTGLTHEVLLREWKFLSAKFSLSNPMSSPLWRHMRMRPQSFPENRIIQLARLFHEGRFGLHQMLEANDILTVVGTFRVSGLSEDTARLIVINTVVPLLYAYGISHREELMKERAMSFLEQLPAENNYILRQWQACGLNVLSAADSQALIQLKREYCDCRRCLHCRFGHEFLSVKG